MNMRKDKKSKSVLHKINIIICFAVLTIIMTVSVANHLFGKINDGANITQLISYKISAGDNLWMLANRIITKNEDVRDKIIAIQNINGLTATQQLHPGQIIQIPVRSTEDNFRFTVNRH